MKRLGDNNFFYVFERMMLKHDPNLELDRWIVDSVIWTQERHTFTCQTHSFNVEVFIGTYPDHEGWSLMVTQKHWWIGTQEKSNRGVILTSGHRSDVMTWMN